MKRILITGSNSYIGNSFRQWVRDEKFYIDTISVRSEDWKVHDFSSYDVILHLAGIAHISTNPKMQESYYKVNRDLTIDIAKKAKEEGVKQFIFMSSIIVYGDSKTNKNVIDRNTVPNPSNFYGKSKLQAEQGIEQLENNNFKIVIIRPPMIYGKGSKGNYNKLAKLATLLPVFPDFENKRSMLYIDNLCELIRLLIINQESGIFFPQNKEYVKTSEMVKLIAETHGKNIKFTKIFNPLIKLLGLNINLINKVFGDLAYDINISNYKTDYRVRELKESIKETESESNDEESSNCKLF